MQSDPVGYPDEAQEAAAEVVTFINEQTGPSCEARLTPNGWTLLDSDSNTRTDFTYDPESAQWWAHIWFLSAEKPLAVHPIKDLHRLKAEVVTTSPPDVLTPVPTEGILSAISGLPLADYALETADRARAQHDAASLLAFAPHPLTIFHFNTGPYLSTAASATTSPSASSSGSWLTTKATTSPPSP